jgi:hypothetical protein
MKIFSPTSRGDWKTFIKSAQPLQAPHFIIDVTRPQDGSTGLSKMNSKNPNQATWRTSDGSPWWLRSTSYSQPSGDYQANCYMHLWNSPHNSENNIQFNDAHRHKCAYHSRSYFCQPKAVKKTKKTVPKPVIKKKKKKQAGIIGAVISHRHVYFEICGAAPSKVTCHYRSKGSSRWSKFGGTQKYRSPVWTCPPWSRGNPNYEQRITVDGVAHYTTETKAGLQGAAPCQGANKATIKIKGLQKPVKPKA